MSLPVRFEEHSEQYMFIYNDDCVALGQYHDGSFFLMEDQDVNMFGNAMQAFSFINSKYRIPKCGVSKQDYVLMEG